MLIDQHYAKRAWPFQVFTMALTPFMKTDGSQSVDVDKYLSESPGLPHDVVGRRNRLMRGTLSVSDISSLMFCLARDQNLGRVGNNYAFIRWALERLKNELVVKEPTLPLSDEYDFNKQLFNSYSQLGLLQNIVLGYPHIIERYSLAVPVIIVKSTKGDLSNGTGALLRYHKDGVDSAYVLTNRHVLENKIINKIHIGSMDLIKEGDVILSNESDLGLFEVQNPSNQPSFLINNFVNVLDSVISLGYPQIPRSDGPTLMIHRGEINGFVSGYDNSKFLAISCHVSPGNSGGPILNSVGQLCGIVAQSNYGKRFSDESAGVGDVPDSTVYHMAIPPEQILKFITEQDLGTATVCRPEIGFSRPAA